MSDAELISAVLKEYSSRLNLDGSSTVLVPDEEIAKTIQDWSKTAYLNYLPTITVDNAAGEWPHKEDSFSHTIARLSDASKESMQLLKWIQWSLKYKGILILILATGLGDDERKVIDFVESACFERGRIRYIERQLAHDDQTTRRSIVLAMKWDLLCA